MNRILLFFLSLSSLLTAQPKHSSTYTVYVNYPSYSVKAEVSSFAVKVDPIGEREYHWYASNKILQTRGGYDGKLLTGAYTAFFLSDNLKEKGRFSNGLKQGEWISWHENGKIKEITSWRKGQKSGTFKKFDPRGELMHESRYKKDKLNGSERSYENGMLVSERKFRRGKEILPKIKKEKKNKDITPASGEPVKKERKIFRKKKDKKQPEEPLNKKKEEEQLITDNKTKPLPPEKKQASGKNKATKTPAEEKQQESFSIKKLFKKKNKTGSNTDPKLSAR